MKRRCSVATLLALSAFLAYACAVSGSTSVVNVPENTHRAPSHEELELYAEEQGWLITEVLFTADLPMLERGDAAVVAYRWDSPIEYYGIEFIQIVGPGEEFLSSTMGGSFPHKPVEFLHVSASTNVFDLVVLVLDPDLREEGKSIELESGNCDLFMTSSLDSSGVIQFEYPSDCFATWDRITVFNAEREVIYQDDNPHGP